MRYSNSYIRTIRLHFGLTQPDLARLLNIDRTLLAHAEAGRRSLPTAAAWQLLPLLNLLPAYGSPVEPLPPDPTETTAKTLDALQWQLRVCRHEAANLAFILERQLPRLLAARRRRCLPTLLAALPPRAPLPGTPADAPTPDPHWPDKMARKAASQLSRLGVQARGLLEARLAGLNAEVAFLEGVLGVPAAA